MLRQVTRVGGGSPRSSVCSVLATQMSARGFFEAKASEEIPLKGLADSIGDAFGPALDAIAEEQRLREPMDEAKKDEVYVPSVPHILPFARMARDSDFLRDVLVFEEKKRMKPRMSWYDPYDTTWVPSGWFTDGGGHAPIFFFTHHADMDYYFSPGGVGGGDKGKSAALEGSHMVSGGGAIQGVTPGGGGAGRAIK